MFITTVVLALVAQGTTGDTRLMRDPDIFGNKVVFTYASDLWLYEIGGGPARRLTSHPGVESNARFSPNGKQIAFSASYDGRTNVYVMPAEGGEPKRLTYEPYGDKVVAWTPDGKIAFTSLSGSPWHPMNRAWFVRPTGGLPIETGILECTHLTVSPDGTKVAYNRNHSVDFNWRRYRGGTQGKISFWDLATGTYSELPAGKENNWLPQWIGDDIYFLSDRNLQTVNLYRYNTKTKKTEQLTRFADGDIKSLEGDSKTLIFERDGKILTYTIATGNIEAIEPRVLSDNLNVRPTLKKLGDQVANVAISPSGKRLIVEARGELFSVPVKNGESRNLTGTSGARESGPVWSPDGKTILYRSDESGEECLYTVPQMGGKATKIELDASHRIAEYRWSPDGQTLSYATIDGSLYLFELASKKTVQVFKDDFGYAGNYDWSPNSKWIVYTKTQDNLFSAIYLYEVATRKSTKVTEGYYNDGAVSFDLSGKYLYAISGRTFNVAPGEFEFDATMGPTRRVYLIPLSAKTPNPLTPSVDEEQDPDKKDPAPKPEELKQVDLEGMAKRAIALPMGADRYTGLIGLEEGVLILVENKLMLFTLASKTAQEVVSGVGQLDLNQKRDKMAFTYGNTVCVSDVRPGVDPNQARVSTSAVEAIVDPRAEWRQIYWDTWRYQRDFFYDPNMLGLDWKAIGEKYAKLIPSLGHRDDLNYVLGLLIGELGTSHAYVGGGDYGLSLPGPNVAVLGADFETYGGRVRFKRIFRGFNYDDSLRAPLGELGVNVKEGEYLLAIDGQELDEKTNPSQFLIGKAGRTVVLTVNDKPTMEGARQVRVRTMANDMNIRRATWVENNRKKVAEMSGGKIGYMHVPNTSEEGLIGLIKSYYSQSDKQAMIVDERFNGGGAVPTMFIEKLARKIMAATRDRFGRDILYPAQTPRGPMAMLINEYAGSGGDLFPWFFKDQKLGPLIGTRTWGGLVGIVGSKQLIDGGFVTAPAFGVYDVKTGKWIAENTGVEPDIVVDARPDLLAQGRDPQLEKAVEYLMKQIEKGLPPIKAPQGYPRVK